MNNFFSSPPFADGPAEFMLVTAAIVAAYAVFTLVGFGSGLIASTPLAALMPVARVIPLLAILDFAGSGTRGWRTRQEVAWGALRQLFPGMLLGQLLGVLVLARLPARPMAVALGLFIVLQGWRGLLKKAGAATGTVFPAYAYGLFGGILGGLFGSGGFVYAAYLERHLESRPAFRATQAVLIALSTGWRIVLCLSLGLIDRELLATALLCGPAMVLGIHLGRRIDLRMSRDQLYRLLHGLLLASGLGLIARFIG